MSERIAKLETIVERLKQDVSGVLSGVNSVGETLARMDARLTTLASTSDVASLSANLDAKASSADVATVAAKLDDKPNTRTVYTISILVAALVAAAAFGGFKG